MFKKCFFGLYEYHVVEDPPPDLISELIKKYRVFTFKYGYPSLTGKIKKVSDPYLELDNGLWCCEFFNGIFYRKWFWSK